MMPRNRVVFVLSLFAFAACIFAGFLTIAPNRLASGQSLTLWQLGEFRAPP